MACVPRWRLVGCVLASLTVWCGALAATAGADPTSTVTVTLAGSGAGTITSDPSGITCSGVTCTGSFDPTATVVLTAVPAPGDGFGGFSGACTPTTATACTVSPATDAQITATFDKPPTAVVTAPADGTAYNADAVPKAGFSCTHDANSPLTSCTATVDGATVSAGDALPSSAGSHTLTVTATDADGSSTTASATYTVHPRPTCGDLAATTNEGAAVAVTLSCADPDASVTYHIDTQPRHGTLASSGRVVTYTPAAGFAGTDSFTYHGASANGLSVIQTVSIVVLAPPTAHISAPAAGQVYSVGESVATRFGCADDPAGPGIRSCADSAGSSDGTGTLNTSGEGHHTYTVTATSRDGQSGSATIDYTVVGKAPQVVVTAPVDNAAYLWSAIPAADFTCLAGAGSTVQSCKATVGAQAISDHEPLPNAFGAHTLTVTATDADGLSSTASATYTVTSAVSLAPVSIQVPAHGARYRLGQVVAARYSCLAATTGPALKSCVGTVRAGRPINTGRLGRHTFSVSATNERGDSTTETVAYTVVPTSNRIVVRGLRAGRSGVARLRLMLPGPGALRVIATARNAAHGASSRRVTYGVAQLRVRRGGSLIVAIAPSAAGRALLRARRARPVVSLVVSYTPTGARPNVVRLRPLPLG